MNLEGQYTFEAPRDTVWEALLDPDVLAKVMPGCEKLEQIGENEYKGILKIKVGPVQGKFEGIVTLSDIQEPDSYHMSVDGKGAPGFLKGEGQVTLEPTGETTIMHYKGHAQVGGRIASVGQRLLDSSAKALTRQSLDGLHEQIKARLQPESETVAANGSAPNKPVSAAAPPTPSQTEFAMGVAKHMLDDFLPAERRPMAIAAGVGALFLLMILNWWMKSVARQAARAALERRYD